MNRGEEPIDRIRKAGNLVAKAEERWNAGNPAIVEECVTTLEESAAELRAVLTTVRGADSLRGLRNELFQIKERVARMERLSQLAAAFLHGGSAAAGASPLYLAGGFEDTESSSMATTAIQA